MSYTTPSQSEILSSIRLSRVYVLADEYDFVTHVYRSIAGRDPEFDATGFDRSTIKVADAWDRCAYIATMLQSPEGRHRHVSLQANLNAFLSALGYVGSRRLLVDALTDFYPTLPEFYEKLDALTTVVAVNTQRIYFGPSAAEFIEQLDVPGHFDAMVAELPAIAATCAQLRRDMRDIVWSIKDLHEKVTQRDGASQSKDDVAGLVLAVLAQLQAGTVK